jgi:mono/diheme cytochrome c family protein
MTKKPGVRTAPVILVAIVLGLAHAAGQALASNTPAGDAARGKELFMKYSCYACHGYSGQNGPGARLVPMKTAQPAFMAYVRNPPRPNLMPSYSVKAMPDKDLADVYAYIKTLPDSAPPVKSIPILEQIQSQN